VRAVVGEFLTTLGKGDADLIGEAFAEEIDWYVPGDQAQGWTGRRTRRDEVPAYFRTMWPVFVPGQSETEIKQILVDLYEDTHLVAKSVAG
jgi:ketosteroid isomerase-like protein